ncbi:hypothetical protein DRO02_06510 [archaeon]|nr:hypothetical protein [Candidatus Baldrarchaeota archaeon]RLG63463.1 MAG: hypothetical protein DRO02_06510 [archaeon]RLG63546.1 MAG: hypothetical protein DRN89_03565 [archaeon]
MLETLINLVYSNLNLIIFLSIPMAIGIPPILAVILKKNEEEKFIRKIMDELENRGFVQVNDPREIEIIKKAIESGDLSDVVILGSRVFKRSYLDKMVSDMVEKARKFISSNRNVDLDSLKKFLEVDDIDILAMVVTRL